MDKLAPVSFNQAVDILNRDRATFKAGMIAMMYETHIELTGRPYTGSLTWTEKDEALLNRLYAEHRAKDK